MIKSKTIRYLKCDRCGYKTPTTTDRAERLLDDQIRRGWACGFDQAGRPLHICRRCRPQHGHEVVISSTLATGAAVDPTTPGGA